jgi:hypothetical protein
VLQHDSLRSFTDDLDANAKPFPLKVMGQSRPSVHYTATMLAAIYRDTADPDINQPSVAASFGTINRRGTILTGTDAYSDQIVAASDGSNTFQGDVFQTKIDLTLYGCKLTTSYGMIVSHSCDIGPVPTVNICPVFPEGKVDQLLMDFLKGKPTPNYKLELQGMLRNEQHRLLGLPPHGQAKSVLPDKPLLVPLSLIIPLPKDKIGSTVLRLTYRANAFFQLRLATLLMRDVQRSDETRDF